MLEKQRIVALFLNVNDCMLTWKLLNNLGGLAASVQTLLPFRSRLHSLKRSKQKGKKKKENPEKSQQKGKWLYVNKINQPNPSQNQLIATHIYPYSMPEPPPLHSICSKLRTWPSKCVRTCRSKSCCWQLSGNCSEQTGHTFQWLSTCCSKLRCSKCGGKITSHSGQRLWTSLLRKGMRGKWMG